MLRKISLLTLALCSQTLANSFDYDSGHSSNTMQFYAGLSGGLERMTGRRADSITEDSPLAAGTFVTTVFANKGMNETNVATSLVSGFLWQFPQSSILLGPEIYIGRGNTISTIQDERPDLNIGGGNSFRHYSTILQRKIYTGLLLRAGYQFEENYLGYVSAGYDKGQFAVDRVMTYEPQTLAATRATNTKWLNGLLVGFGLEKKCSSFIVGLDFRIIKYNTLRITDGLNNAVGFLPGSMNFSTSPRVYSGTLRISYQF